MEQKIRAHETTIQLIDADQYQRGSYGIQFTSARKFKVTGKGVHSRHHPHELVVWDNTTRPNPTGAGGAWIDPNGRATDENVSIHLSARAIVIAKGSSIDYSATELTIGQTVHLLYPDDTMSGPYVITARNLADPVLILA